MYSGFLPSLSSNPTALGANDSDVVVRLYPRWQTYVARVSLVVLAVLTATMTAVPFTLVTGAIVVPNPHAAEIYAVHQLGTGAGLVATRSTFGGLLGSAAAASPLPCNCVVRNRAARLVPLRCGPHNRLKTASRRDGWAPRHHRQLAARGPDLGPLAAP